MKILINYADVKYKSKQKLNSKSGLKRGSFDKVIEYGPDKLDNDFYAKNSSFIERNERGAGYWIWKPYIILDTLLNKARKNDYIFYCDAGAMFLDSVDYLIYEMENSHQNIFLTEIPLLEYQWTKRECFIKLGCTENRYLYSNQIQSGFILIKKTDDTIKFFEEYYRICSDYDMINDEKDININKELIDHRHDQSVLSLLAKKKDLIFFRDISQYGIRPWQYVESDRDYCIKSYSNSHYPQIVNLYRRDNWLKVLLKEKVKDILGFRLRI